MNSNTSNPDEAENSTGKSTKKNIPGLALLLLDLAVALVGFYIGTHVFWKDQNEESVIVAGAMSAAWATFSWAVFGPMLGRDRSTKFKKGIFLMSMLASWDAGVAMACVNYGGKGTSLSWSGTSLWLLSVGFVYCWYVACAIIVRDVMPSKFRLKIVPIPLLIGMGLSGLLYYVEGPIHTFIRLICVVMFWLSALSLAYCWPDGKNRFRSCRLRLATGMAVRDFLDLVSKERNNRIDHIRQHQGLGSPRQTISSRIHQEKRHQSQSNECGA
ncbi:hypothetical protein [Bifidobacterium longum]|uniref:hypothetical protein n=1 Tax=Bifidobacterium longum TaxID=216816 RepID=UPI00226A5748|nr:hypothetical protein [Bifidobacterium longum]